MRKLYLMVGAPGVGKSRWIRENELQNYVLSPDDIRDIMGTPKYKLNPTDNKIQASIDHSREGHVWKLYNQLLEERMQRGETIVADSTHLYKGAFSQYNKLRQKYHYEVYIVDMMADIYEHLGAKKTAELIIKQDSLRDGYHKVGAPVVYKYMHRYEKFREGANLQWITYIKPINPEYRNVVPVFPAMDMSNFNPANYPVSFKESIEPTLTNMNNFDTIKIIGDIHGDYTNLKEVFEDHHKGTAYIFVGDYLDRGYENAKVLKFLNDLKGNNIFFLRGNHELHWQQLLYQGALRGTFGHTTIKELSKELGYQESLAMLKNLEGQLQDYLYFTFNGEEYLISHVGIEPLAYGMFETRVGLMNESEFIMGLGELYNDNPYDTDVDARINNEEQPHFYQFHGHRNEFGSSVGDWSNNLTQEGEFRYAVLSLDNDEISLYTHHLLTVDGPEAESLKDKLEHNVHIDNKPLEDGIVANNFSKEAFYHGNWDKMTTKARGLFTRDNEVVGRGFTKFFNEDEKPTDSLDTLHYPVIGYRKYNGFLGLVFWDKETNKMKVYTKGGTGRYANLARKVLKNSNNWTKLTKYFKYAWAKDTTVLFEIVAPDKDPHIVQYDLNKAYPIAVIINDIEEHYSEVGEAFWKIKEHNGLFLAENQKDLIQAIKYDQFKNPTQEGIVLRGANKQLKIKSPFYYTAKELRRLMNKDKASYEHYLELKQQARKEGNYNYKPFEYPTLDEYSFHYFNSREWLTYVRDREIRNFSPELALEIYDKLGVHDM